jgi:phenylacetate-CoA ligase
MNLLPTAAHLEDRWGCPIYSTYASTELATTFCECKERRGGHLRPELIIVEILNERGEPVASGAEGEVVATPLGVEGTPLLRYQTGDIARLIEEPCVCGRNTPRLGPIRGRKNQMLKVKGTTIFPGAIISALETLQGVAGCCVEAHRSPDGGDRVTVHVACDSDDVTADKLASHVAAHTRVTPEIQRITVEALTAMIVMPGKRKPVTFLDRR